MDDEDDIELEELLAMPEEQADAYMDARLENAFRELNEALARMTPRQRYMRSRYNLLQASRRWSRLEKELPMGDFYKQHRREIQKAMLKARIVYYNKQQPGTA
jgi:hypothetical protein